MTKVKEIKSEKEGPKKRFFEVSKKTSSFLGCTLGIYLVVELFKELGQYLGLARVSRGPIIYGISRITQSGVGDVLISLVIAGSIIIMYEALRRALSKDNSLLKYIVLAMMTLIVCDFLVGLVPDFNGSNYQNYMQPSRLDTFSERFKTVGTSVEGLLEMVLAIGLMIKYRGKILIYGGAVLVCHFLSGLLSAVFMNLYSADPLAYIPKGYAKIAIISNYILMVLPMVFLKLTMKHQVVYESEKDGDLKNE